MFLSSFIFFYYCVATSREKKRSLNKLVNCGFLYTITWLSHGTFDYLVIEYTTTNRILLIGSSRNNCFIFINCTNKMQEEDLDNEEYQDNAGDDIENQAPEQQQQQQQQQGAI